MRWPKPHFLIALVLCATLLAGCTNTSMNNNKSTPVAQDSANDPLTIHKRAIAIDMHADTAQRLLDEQVDLQQELSDGHFDAVRAKSGASNSGGRSDNRYGADSTGSIGKKTSWPVYSAWVGKSTHVELSLSNVLFKSRRAGVAVTPM